MRPDLVAVEEPLHEELPPRRPAEAQAEAACQEAASGLVLGGKTRIQRNVDLSFPGGAPEKGYV